MGEGFPWKPMFLLLALIVAAHATWICSEEFLGWLKEPINYTVWQNASARGLVAGLLALCLTRHRLERSLALLLFILPALSGGLILYLSQSGRMYGRFELLAKLLPKASSGAPFQLAIELRSHSRWPTKLEISGYYSTNSLPGYAFLRWKNGEVCRARSLADTRLIPGFEPAPNVVPLAPGGSHIFVHELSDFAFFESAKTHKNAAFETLEQRFIPGTEIWCAMDVLVRAPIKEAGANELFSTKKAASLLSNKIRHPGQ